MRFPVDVVNQRTKAAPKIALATTGVAAPFCAANTASTTGPAIVRAMQA